MKTTELVKDWLATQGFKYNVDADGDVQFKYQTIPMYVLADPNDPLFLRIVISNIYDVNDDNRSKVYEALNGVNAGIKAIKAFCQEDNVFLAIEMYIDSEPDINDYIERCLDILVASLKKFADLIRE